MRNATRLEQVNRAGLLALMLVCGALVACGDDTSDAAGSGGTSSAGTTANPMSATGGVGGMGATTGGTSGASGAAGTAGGDAGFMIPMPVCTEPLPTVAITCGGTACEIPQPLPIIGDTCARPCCAMGMTGEVCGTKGTVEGSPSDCVAPPEPDSRCPNLDYMGTPLEGCCTAENKCGIISTLRNMCVTESMIVTLPANPPNCDDPNIDLDGGTE